MAGDSIGEKLRDVPPKVMVGGGLAVVLLLVLVWAWWPAPQPKLTDEQLKAQQNLTADKDANPPVADVPPPADGPRRKAIQIK
jgi:hypothetical protein